MAFMGGIAEGAEVGVVRGFDADGAARADQAMEFLHGADDIVHMLDDVNGGEAVEGAVGERIGEAIEVDENVGAAGGIPVDSNGTGLLMNPAADVEDSHPCCVASRRHCSNVWIAKSHWSRVMTS